LNTSEPSGLQFVRDTTLSQINAPFEEDGRRYDGVNGEVGSLPQEGDKKQNGRRTEVRRPFCIFVK
jgi:hypothetical protein